MSRHNGCTASYATDVEIYATSELYNIDVFVRVPESGSLDWNRYSFKEGRIFEDCDHSREFIAIHNESDHYKLVYCSERPCNCVRIERQQDLSNVQIEQSSGKAGRPLGLGDSQFRQDSPVEDVGQHSWSNTQSRQSSTEEVEKIQGPSNPQFKPSPAESIKTQQGISNPLIRKSVREIHDRKFKVKSKETEKSYPLNDVRLPGEHLESKLPRTSRAIREPLTYPPKYGQCESAIQIEEYDKENRDTEGVPNLSKTRYIGEILKRYREQGPFNNTGTASLDQAVTCSPIETEGEGCSPREENYMATPACEKLQNRRGAGRLHIIYTNADGIAGKHAELREEMSKAKPDIVAITETKLLMRIEDSTVFPRGYVVTRKDRDREDGGGGIALLVRDGIRSEEVDMELDSDFSEFVLRILKLNAVEIIVLVVYIPTRRQDRDEDYNKNNKGAIELLNRVSQLAVTKGSRLLVLGDFNYGKIDWEEFVPHGDSDSWEAKFLDCIQGNYLYQHVREPTRVRGTDKPSRLDLVFTQNFLEIECMDYGPPFGKSDHCVLSMNFVTEDDLPEVTEPQKEKKMNRGKADMIKLREMYGGLDWIESFEEKTTQLQLGFFNHKCLEGVNKYVPISVVTQEEGHNKWFNVACKKAKKNRDRAWRRHRKRGGIRGYERYIRARNKYVAVRRNAEKHFLKDLSRKAKENPKLFHSFLRSKRRVKEQVVKLLKEKGGIANTDKEICEELSEAFQSAFTIEDTPPPHIELIKHAKGTLEEIKISVAEVRTLLKELDPHKAPGPDKIATFILKECAEELATPLTYIFESSLRTGEVPIEWRIADIIAIYKKKGDRKRAKNYRPVSLTSVVCKVLEKIIKKQMLEHLDRIGFLQGEQHGFREGRSTVTNLLEFYDKVSNILQERDGWADCIYLDFQKAFDSVPHERLLEKLDKLAGVKGDLLRWIRAYLTDRWQRVKVRTASSSLRKVTSGVPQGSVLGPLLFMIYINDLPEGIKSFMSMFADDTKVLKRIEDEESCRELQNDLDMLQQWSEKWLMTFNASKCKVISMGKSKNRPNYKYTLQGSVLEKSESERDLGVLIMPDLSPEKHINAIVKSAYALLANIRVSFRYIDKEMFKNIYVAYVRPKLEYAAPVWNPHLRKHIQKLERVQRHATRMVPELRDLSYDERLKELDLPTLEQRRERGDMITVFKFMKGFDKVNCKNYFERNHDKTRGHSWKIKKRKVRRDNRKYFFSNRVVDKWNSLDSEVVKAASIHSFKARYDRLR